MSQSRTYPAPHPTESTSSTVFAAHPEEERNIFCTHYARCLDHAVAAAWENWTCRQCPLARVQVQRPNARDFANDRRRGYD